MDGMRWQTTIGKFSSLELLREWAMRGKAPKTQVYPGLGNSRLANNIL